MTKAWEPGRGAHIRLREWFGFFRPMIATMDYHVLEAQNWAIETPREGPWVWRRGAAIRGCWDAPEKGVNAGDAEGRLRQGVAPGEARDADGHSEVLNPR